jgi:GGDEF domain-containing protein
MVALDTSDWDGEAEDVLPACVVVTHSSGHPPKGQRTDVRDGLSIGTTSADAVVVEGRDPATRLSLDRTMIGVRGRWQARSTGRAWVNRRNADNVVVSSGDELRIEDTFFRFLSGPDLQQKFYETIYHLTITDFPSGLGNQRAFGEAFRTMAAQAAKTTSTLLVAVVGVEVLTPHATTASHDVIAPVVERLREKAPRGWYAARLAELEIGVLIPDDDLEQIETRLAQWWAGRRDESNTRVWQGVAQTDHGADPDGAVAIARARRRSQSG